MGQSELQTKCTIQMYIQKLLYLKGDNGVTLKLSYITYYLIFICFTNTLPIITYCFSFIENTQQEIIHNIRSDTLYSLNRIS